MHLKTDPATVVSLVKSVVTNERRVKTQRSCGDVGEAMIGYARKFNPGIRIKVSAKLCAR